MALTTPPDSDRLYKLLPSLYRQADADNGLALQALLRLIGTQVEQVRGDIQQLWDNFFIETCQPWAVPYIGDLVANRTLHDIDLAQDAATAAEIFTDLAGKTNLKPVSAIRTRADVARTIYYRRRKGTVAMLEELAGDVTGWGAHVVEFFQLLTWPQNLNHLRLHSTGCADLRKVSACSHVAGPFDCFSHNVDVRPISQSEGWHNVPNLGFFLWRLESLPFTYIKACQMPNSTWRFTFSPLGNTAPLFTRWPRAVREPGLSPELFVPGPIPPAGFFDDLAAWAVAAPQPAESLYYGEVSDGTPGSLRVYEMLVVTGAAIQSGTNTLKTTSPFFVQDDVGARIEILAAGGNGTTLTTAVSSFVDAQTVTVNDAAFLSVANGSFRIYRPVALKDITCSNLDNWTTLAQPAGTTIGIDVKRGRLAVGAQRPAAAIYVSHNHGFSANMGGGPYPDRQKWLVPNAAAEQVITVDSTTTLDTALNTWATGAPANTIINIADNDTHPITNPQIQLQPAKWLVIQAMSGELGYRPHIQPKNGVLQVNGSSPGSTLTLGGLLFEGVINVSQDIQKLRLLHTTLVPDGSINEETVPTKQPSVVIQSTDASNKAINATTRVEIAFSITGALQIPETVDSLWVLDSIVDGTTFPAAIANAAGKNGPLATIERSTILGTTFFRKFDLCSDVIFTDIVTVEDCVEGCLRFSFVPANSTVPQQYRCQPSLEIDAETAALQAQTPNTPLTPAQQKAVAKSVQAWLAPVFGRVNYGRPDYCQLTLAAPLQIRAGGSDGAEMGAFNHLKQPQREANLLIRLQEYVPFGRAPGIIYVT